MKEFNKMKKYKLLNWYWEKLLATTAKTVDINFDETVLDFGAGEQQLRKHLPTHAKYVSCDTNTNTNPNTRNLEEIKHADIIFASNVLEHMQKRELEKKVEEIHKLKPRYLVVAIPRETSWLNKTLNFLCNTTFEHGWEHKQGWKQILNTLSEHFEIVKAKDFWFMQWIITLKPKERKENESEEIYLKMQ